jgi:hypothetical protein
MLHSLATFAAKDVHEFSRMHTLLPYRNAYSYEAVGRLHGTWEPEAVKLRLGLALIRPGPRTCSACIAEDLHFWGFPYFRRIHQLPGLDWCVKHGSPLQILSNRAIDALPFAKDIVNVAERSDEMASPAIGRFVEISAGLLDSPAVASEADLLSGLIQRADAVEAEITAPRLGELLLDVFPVDWLRRLLDVRYSSKGEQRLDRLSVDPRRYNSKPTVLYVLLLAALFPTPEEALAVGRRNHSVAVCNAGLERERDQAVSRPIVEAFNAFQGGMNMNQAARNHGVEVKRLEDLIRAALANSAVALGLMQWSQENS